MVYKILILVIVVFGIIFFYPKKEVPVVVEKKVEEIKKIPDIEILQKNLKIPWDIAFVDDGYLVTERAGNLLYFKKDQKITIKIPHPIPKGEGGLLGITLHPHFIHNNLLYLYMTTGGTMNAVFQYEFVDDSLKNEKIIIKDIPGSIYHDGGRMEFGPDEKLYITTGDATKSEIAQNLKSLGGKILRLNDDGTIPEDNPFHTAVWSYGHRNPQGLAWDPEGNLWETEHGRSGVLSGMDEVNMIEKGKNYGWPTIEGSKTKAGLVTPVLNSGADVTWAPASLLYYQGSLFFGGLKGETLYEMKLDTKELKSHFKNEYGRIRTVRKGPDGMFYILTSNQDGRGKPTADDDRLIKVNPLLFSENRI